MQLSTETWSELKNGSVKLIDAIGADAKQQAALLLMGHRFFEQGKLKEARRIFGGLAVLDNSNPYVYAMLGAIFQKEERHELALSCYNKSLELFPEDINSLVNRGETLLKLGRFAEAALDFKQSITLDPSQQHPAANRARLLVLLVQDAITLAEEKRRS
jgi:Flp pilus assembly protein TadD